MNHPRNRKEFAVLLEKAREMLKTHFGYASFRPGQEQAISSVLDGHHTICVMPTGGGKSKFQLLSSKEQL